VDLLNMTVVAYNRLVRGLLLRGNGRPRRFSTPVVFRRSDGSPRWPFSRILFRKNGSPRTRFDADTLAFLDSVPLNHWIERHDTPGADVLAGFDASKAAAKMVIMVDRETAASLGVLVAAIAATSGVALELVLAAAEPLPDEDAAQIEAAFQSPIHDIAALPALSGPVILLMQSALPRAHGPRLLIDALQHSGAVLAYADEVGKLPYGGYAKPWFKPKAHAPVLASQGNLLGNMVAVDLAHGEARAMLADALHAGTGFRAALAAMAYRLPASAVRHLATVASVNTRPGPPPLPGPLPDLPADLPTVSVIIPTRDGWNVLGPCLKSLGQTDWPREKLEILVVDNGSREPETLSGLEAAKHEDGIRILLHDEEFNFARINNLAVREARGTVLVFLNNDTEARTPDWLRHLVRFALLPRAGAVGPKLLYADGTVQHAGMVLGMHGGAAHAFVGIRATEGGYQNLAVMSREIGAVTGACIAITREAFAAVGGFNETFKVAFNDVVLCADLIGAGYQNYYAAAPLFHHYESKTRGKGNSPAKLARESDERVRAAALHPDLFHDDPFYSPCLSLDVSYGLARVPRRTVPWRALMS
jgi:GT2 family glycosyltransferase